MAIKSFDESALRKIAEIMADAYSHRELSDLLGQCHIAECGGTPKWERVLNALRSRQRSDACGNNVGAFIQTALNPLRFVGRSEVFSRLRDAINVALAFSALRIGDDGKLSTVSQACTLTEAQERAGRLRSELILRKVHAYVLQFCRAELLQENDFHAVLEATKSVAQKLRDKTGLAGDGRDLVDPVFSISDPILAINSLRTDTEKAEQKGFANLLRGVFGTFRNPTAHAPKVSWPISEDDALDLLSMVSYSPPS